jgi:hypothetical protein
MSQAAPSTPSAAPEWFERRVRRGLAALTALRLDGHPPADVIEATAKVWVQALWPGRAWDEALDAARIGEAFRLLALHETRWPTPAHFLRSLPARPAQRALPEPAISAEQREQVRAMLSEFAQRIRSGDRHARRPN